MSAKARIDVRSDSEALQELRMHFDPQRLRTIKWSDGDIDRDLHAQATSVGQSIAIMLPHAVTRSQPVTLTLEWIADLVGTPDFVVAGGWYPQLEAARADFDVSLTLPSAWTVAATGREVSASVLPTSPGRSPTQPERQIRLTQADVGEFVWVAGSALLERSRRIALAAGVPAGVDIRLLLQREHAALADRLLDAAAQAVRDYSEWFVKYPDDHLTIVDAPRGTGLDGRSHARLVLIENRWLQSETRLDPEARLVAAISRQWWGGMVAFDNDARDLEHGICRYLQSLIVERLFDRRFQRQAFSAYEQRLFGGFVPWTTADVLVPRVARAVGPSRPEWALLTLERYLGRPTLERALRILAEQAASSDGLRLSRAAFIRTVSDVAGQDLSWFFETPFQEPAIVDYRIERLSSDPDEGCPFSPCYRTGLTVRASGTGRFGRPIDVLVIFADGQRAEAKWDGVSLEQFVYRSRARAVSATVDAAHTVLMDRSYTNNSRTLVPHSKRAATRWSARWLIWLEHLLLSYATLA